MKKISSFTIFIVLSIIMEVFIIAFFEFIHNKPIDLNCAESAFLKTVQSQKYYIELTISKQSLLRQYNATIDQVNKKQTIWIDDAAKYTVDYQANELRNNDHIFSTDSIADIRDIIFLIADNYTKKEQREANTWIYYVSRDSFENYFEKYYTDLNNSYIGYNVVPIQSVSPIEIVFQDGFISIISFSINDIQIIYKFSNYNGSSLGKKLHELPEREQIITAVYNHYSTNLMDTIPKRP